MSAFDRKSLGQFWRFLLVGVLNTLVDLVVTRLLQGGFALLTNALLLTYYIPKVIGYLCGVCNSYLLNSAWTFRAERRRDAREIISFLLVNGVTLGLSLLLMYLFRDVLGLAGAWDAAFAETRFGRIVNGNFFCTVLSSGIALLVNFVGNKILVFGERKRRSA
ncbi:MAG: GtrA family protein [Clostridia bacterium]|nr:GtrA family protein [Clostridia bacterium]